MQCNTHRVKFRVDETDYEFDPTTGTHTYDEDDEIAAILARFESPTYTIIGPNQDGLEHLASTVWESPTPAEMARRIRTTLHYLDGVELIHD